MILSHFCLWSSSGSRGFPGSTAVGRAQGMSMGVFSPHTHVCSCQALQSPQSHSVHPAFVILWILGYGVAPLSLVGGWLVWCFLMICLPKAVLYPSMFPIVLSVKVVCASLLRPLERGDLYLVTSWFLGELWTLHLQLSSASSSDCHHWVSCLIPVCCFLVGIVQGSIVLFLQACLLVDRLNSHCNLSTW